jgi:ribose 5-phosphate isomerase A
VTIDGADEVEVGSLNLIKGLGGALLREKIVASASKRMVITVDESKLVDRLGQHAPVPVEIVAFGRQVTLDRLADLGGGPTLRMAGDEPYRTDSGNHIADCAFAEIGDPADLERRLAAITGVVESGLFISLAARVVVGTRSGMRVLER